MNVPDFELDDDYSIPVSSSTRVAGKSTMSEDDVMEVVWHDGQLVTQRQSQARPNSGQTPQKRPAKYDVVSTMREHITATAPAPESQIFMHEDEMASWLHYPLNDDAFCSDLLYTAAKSPPVASPRPPVHPIPASRKPETAAQNFLMFSGLNNNSNNTTSSSSRFEAAAAALKSVVRETTMVLDSSDTPLVGPISGAADFRPDNNNDSRGISVGGVVSGRRGGGGGAGRIATLSSATAEKEGTCEMSLTSSPGGGSTSGSGSLSAELASTQKPQLPPLPVDRKRKGRGDAECQDEDVDFESGSAKKQKPGSSSTRRSRAAEVHNLSERRRRDIINEKMRVLQEMIPRCNKSDKASMLEEAIEYMKSLKLQLQMVSMGCGMVPMMFPGVPPYMPMGMAQMGMGMSRHMMPYGNVLPGSPMPPAAHLGPKFPMPAYQMQTMPPEDPNRVQATNQSENMLHMPHTESQNQSQGPNFVDPYQQYFTPQQMQMQMQMQMQLQQQQAMAQPSSTKPSSSTSPENQDSLQ